MKDRHQSGLQWYLFKIKTMKNLKQAYIEIAIFTVLCLIVMGLGCALFTAIEERNHYTHEWVI